MPGPITHLIVQERLSPYLREFGGERGHRLADLLDVDRCSPYAGFGSMGPDFLFFSLKEYGSPLDDLTGFLFDVYKAFGPLIDFYEDNIEPVVSTVEDAIATLDNALFQGLFQQIGDTANLLSNTALEAAAVAVTRNVDLFYPFYPKIQEGAAETDWYWFDFLHYRRTGTFTSHMWELAAGDADLQRYVLGYAGHLATDVVGHPFVNAVTGGPYRTHWHRHKLVENWIDAYARTHYQDSVATINCLRLGPKDRRIGNAVSGSYYSRLTEFPGGDLPRKLGDLLAGAMRNVYGGIDHPPFLDFNDLDLTYRLWLEWFERATSIGDVQRPTPVPPPGGATIALINDFASGFPAPPGAGSAPGGGGFSLLGVFGALVVLVKYLIEAIAYTVFWIVTHSLDILALPFTEAVAMMKWLLYQVQKGVWEVYDNLRFLLVLGGYLFPEPRDLAKSPWGQAFINTTFTSLTGGPTPDFFHYPRKQEVHGLTGPIEHHLVYPGVLREREHAEPAPMPFHGANPETFISGGFAWDPRIEALYDCIGPYGSTDQFTHHVDRNTWSDGQLGSALSFSARLISTRIRDIPNFNLDGDRGYGWKTWRARSPGTIETDNPVAVEYIDT